MLNTIEDRKIFIQSALGTIYSYSVDFFKENFASKQNYYNFFIEEISESFITQHSFLLNMFDNALKENNIEMLKKILISFTTHLETEYNIQEEKKKEAKPIEANKEMSLNSLLSSVQSGKDTLNTLMENKIQINNEEDKIKEILEKKSLEEPEIVLNVNSNEIFDSKIINENEEEEINDIDSLFKNESSLEINNEEFNEITSSNQDEAYIENYEFQNYLENEENKIENTSSYNKETEEVLNNLNNENNFIEKESYNDLHSLIIEEDIGINEIISDNHLIDNEIKEENKELEEIYNKNEGLYNDFEIINNNEEEVEIDYGSYEDYDNFEIINNNEEVKVFKEEYNNQETITLNDEIEDKIEDPIYNDEIKDKIEEPIYEPIYNDEIKEEKNYTSIDSLFEQDTVIENSSNNNDIYNQIENINNLEEENVRVNLEEELLINNENDNIELNKEVDNSKEKTIITENSVIIDKNDTNNEETNIIKNKEQKISVIDLLFNNFNSKEEVEKQRLFSKNKNNINNKDIIEYIFMLEKEVLSLKSRINKIENHNT